MDGWIYFSLMVASIYYLLDYYFLPGLQLDHDPKDSASDHEDGGQQKLPVEPELRSVKEGNSCDD